MRGTKRNSRNHPTVVNRGGDTDTSRLKYIEGGLLYEPLGGGSYLIALDFKPGKGAIWFIHDDDPINTGVHEFITLKDATKWCDENPITLIDLRD